MQATFEIVQDVLFITGNLDRATDTDFQQALTKYMKSTPSNSQFVVDMSNVRWLAPTGAKALIAAGQEINEKNHQLRVLASRHVLQTLNLLGAKSWLAIESCSTPNPRPGETQLPPQPSGAATATESAAEPKVEPAASGDTKHPVHSPTPVPAAPAAAAEVIAMTPRTGGTLAGPHEELAGGANLLRVLHPNRRYSFHFEGGDMILGLVRERLGGAWIIVETAGARKIINLDCVAYCEIL